jgi:hypothetical protein
MDFVATAPSDSGCAQQAEPNWCAYPPDGLRVLFNIAALDHLKFSTEATTLRTTWTTAYPPPYPMAEFEPDIEHIVASLLDGPYPEFKGKSLTQVISFGAAAHAQSKLVARALAQGSAPVGQVRALFAGARLAYEADPARFARDSLDSKVLATVNAMQTASVRGLPASQPTATDTATADRLFDRLQRLRRGAR